MKFSPYIYIYDITSFRNSPTFVLKPVITKFSNGKIIENQIGGVQWDCSCLLHTEIKIFNSTIGKKKKLFKKYEEFHSQVPKLNSEKKEIPTKNSFKNQLNSNNFGLNKGIFTSFSSKPTNNTLIPSKSSVLSSIIAKSSTLKLEDNKKLFVSFNSSKLQLNLDYKSTDTSFLFNNDSDFDRKRKKIKLNDQQETIGIEDLNENLVDSKEVVLKSESGSYYLQELVIAGCSDGKIRCWSLTLTPTNTIPPIPNGSSDSIFNNFVYDLPQPKFEWIVQPPNFSSSSFSSSGMYYIGKENVRDNNTTKDPIIGLVSLSQSDLLSVTSLGAFTRWNYQDLVTSNSINFFSGKEPKIINHFTIHDLLQRSINKLSEVPQSYFNKKILKVNDLRKVKDIKDDIKDPDSSSFLNQFLHNSSTFSNFQSHFIELFLEDGSIYQIDPYNKDLKILVNSNLEQFFLKENCLNSIINNNETDQSENPFPSLNSHNLEIDKNTINRLIKVSSQKNSQINIVNPIYSSFSNFSDLYLVCNSAFSGDKYDNSQYDLHNRRTILSLKQTNMNLHLDIYSHYSTQNISQTHSLTGNSNIKYFNHNNSSLIRASNNDSPTFPLTLNNYIIKAKTGSNIITFLNDVSSYFTPLNLNEIKKANQFKIEFYNFDMLLNSYVFYIDKVCKNKVLLTSPYTGPSILNGIPSHSIQINVKLISYPNEVNEIKSSIFTKSLNSAIITCMKSHPNLPILFAGTNNQSLIIISCGLKSNILSRNDNISDDYFKKLYPNVLSEKEKISIKNNDQLNATSAINKSKSYKESKIDKKSILSFFSKKI